MRHRPTISTLPSVLETATSAPQPECIRTPMAARFIAELRPGVLLARVYKIVRKISRKNGPPRHLGRSGGDPGNLESYVVPFSLVTCL